MWKSMDETLIFQRLETSGALVNKPVSSIVIKKRIILNEKNT